MSIYVIGDIHGNLIKLLDLLMEARLIDQGRKWSGGAAQLWFMGDFFDRGPHGIGVVDLIMRLQPQASAEGGEVRALLGNHEVLFLAAQRFRQRNKFMLAWKRNGGQDADMAQATSRHIAWLRGLPAMARVQQRLFMHADAMFYFDYGNGINAINDTISAVLRGDDLDDWDQLIEAFSERMAFSSPHVNGLANAFEYLDTLGVKQIVHGHTPIQYVADTLEPREPFIYANKMCIDVDGGMYLGAPGFVYKLPE
ncbi:MAG TPA: metallophosphoesterase family protein [Phototrophicaceae bacterium]|nr:metallophosphoesterase family protein [Phototrophicaceae bacterium]